ncbi:hypothetical protein [Paenibacillus sp. FSL H8-0537]|uniref:hypothetical protein n=1 Tax=Paenibacillus sp. FSL H8-0537 TaxID=2921399 RepID=UPI003100B492
MRNILLVNDIPAKHVFKKELSPTLLSHVHAGVLDGYELSNLAMRDIEFIGSYVGKRIRSQLQNAAVEFSIEQRIHKFKLAVDIVQADNSVRTFPHYQFKFNSSMFTVSRTSRASSLPRTAIFRSKNAALNHQISFSISENSFVHETTPSQKMVTQNYFLLVHGGKTRPEFMRMGVPHPMMKNWLYQFDLMQVPILIQHDKVEREEITEKTLVSFKEKLIKREDVQGNGPQG